MYDNPDICSACKGACCKRFSGLAHPDDFLRLYPAPTLFVSLIHTLESKQWVIDWWEGDPRNRRNSKLARVEYVRPRCLPETELYSPQWGGGTCGLLTDTGCMLSSDMRPFQCRMFQPKLGGDENCTMPSGATKQALAIAWIPYQSELTCAAKYVLNC